MDAILALYMLGAVVSAASLSKLRSRLVLSSAKHPSLPGHSRLARRLSTLAPFYEYDETEFFRSDDAPEEIAALRRTGFMRLSEIFRERFADTVRLTAEVEDSISDLQFTNAYRVPFQYRRLVRRHLNAGAFVRSSDGVT